MKRLLSLVAFATLLTLPACAGVQGPDAERTALAVEWLRKEGTDPVDYVVTKFTAHQCVMIGEMHEIRQNCAFVSSLLPRVFHDQSVLVLATEFLRVRHTDAMNRLLMAAEYDEAAVLALMRDGPWPTWGYQEYADVFRAVWQVNRDKMTDGPGLRVLGLDSDWSQHDLWFGSVTPEQRMRILLAREQTMIDAIADGPMKSGEKVLVHCGYGHSITCHGERLGTVLTRRFGEKVTQVALHHELRSEKARSWLTEWLEKVVADGGKVPVGFDLDKSPFADLRDPKLPQWQLAPKAGIGDLCHGYVVLAPVDQLQRVRWIPGFVTDETFGKAADIADRMGIAKKGECKNAAELDARMLARFPRNE